ncbi:hypothetical protein L873DRAFT_1788539 [Choiromyces venosus 120613-1]|uniref:Uncharacterized protein n=1 Tax=Choiromyces venosus 120613-1 TaxID=1336337 RepID=A0A3N4JSC9_9PEZI|nr:hypothetical protein L873DRAFT_1788539 [Choiromyces venosus 120613-1]
MMIYRKILSSTPFWGADEAGIRIVMLVKIERLLAKRHGRKRRKSASATSNVINAYHQPHHSHKIQYKSRARLNSTYVIIMSFYMTSIPVTWVKPRQYSARYLSAYPSRIRTVYLHSPVL